MGGSKRLNWVPLAALLAALLAAHGSARADSFAPTGATIPAGGRSSHGLVWTGQSAYLFGGFVDAPPLTAVRSEILRYDPRQGSVTTMSATLPTARGGVAAVWTGSSALIFGGTTEGTTDFDDIVTYDPATDTAEVMTAHLPSARYGISAVWDPRSYRGCRGGCAYLFGGSPTGGGALTEILRYSPATDAITTMDASLPRGLRAANAFFDGEFAFVLGGNGSGSASDEILRYDPTTDSLTTMQARLPSARSHLALAWDGTHAVGFGGWIPGGQRGTYLDDSFRYDPVSDTVSPLTATLTPARLGAAAFWDGGSFLLTGGHSLEDRVLDDILRYRPDVPAAPLSLTSTTLLLQGVDLAWFPPHGGGDVVSGYRLYRRTDVLFQLIAEVGADVTEYFDGGCKLLQECVYEVTAFNTSGESARSNQAEALGTVP